MRSRLGLHNLRLLNCLMNWDSKLSRRITDIRARNPPPPKPRRSIHCLKLQWMLSAGWILWQKQYLWMLRGTPRELTNVTRLLSRSESRQRCIRVSTLRLFIDASIPRESANRLEPANVATIVQPFSEAYVKQQTPFLAKGF